MLFLRKTDETIWTPSPFLREAPSQLTQFFHDPLFVQISKMRPPLILGGDETM